ncbi:MAG: N-acetylmuramoyl-L-alanine amidase [Eubacteriales bacterium]|nr:N-acetylmuramoyl-L-alanine amidase [Eubacteriales bacterium]
MIIVMKKSNILLVGLIILLIAAIYSLNFGHDSASAFISSKTKTVVVDAGHGGEDPGAVSSYSGLREKDVTLKIAFYLKDELEKSGYKVIMTRTEDILKYKDGTTRIYDKRKQDLTRRKQIMDDPKVDIVVSIHLNKFEQTRYYGAQTLFPPRSDESKKLADSIQKVIGEKLDPTNKRLALVKNEEIVIMRDLKTPTALVECGFLTNEAEERKLGTDEYQQQIAVVLKEGIDRYFQ